MLNLTLAMKRMQCRQLQLNDPMIADEYRQQLHKLFTNHKVYRHVTQIIARSNSKEWSILDEVEYKKIDQDITDPC
jgi:hypothetical protein